MMQSSPHAQVQARLSMDGLGTVKGGALPAQSPAAAPTGDFPAPPPLPLHLCSVSLVFLLLGVSLALSPSV